MRMIVLAMIGLASALGNAAARADVLQVPDQSAAQSTASLPARGMTMAQVEQRFGPPADRIAAVGQPPISRWVYPSYVVFFERNLVIHTVARNPADAPR